MYVEIGGIEQWIQIEGNNPDNPVLLFLHGGPGGTSVPAAMAWKPWEEHFTLVHWDQRGAAQTFQRNGAAGCGPLTLDRILEDAIELTDYLRASRKQEKILLVGHSWGAIVGVHLAKRRPELYSALVATGLMANFRQNEAFIYQRLLMLAAKSANTEALEGLQALGPPPYSDRASFLSFRQWMETLAETGGDGTRPNLTPLNPDITPAIVEAIKAGAEYSRMQLFPAYRDIDLPALGTDFAIPIFFFHGTADQVTPYAPAVQYFDSIAAPHKALVAFEGCQHFFVFNRPDDFLRELVGKVRPLL